MKYLYFIIALTTIHCCWASEPDPSNSLMTPFLQEKLHSQEEEPFLDESEEVAVEISELPQDLLQKISKYFITAASFGNVFFSSVQFIEAYRTFQKDAPVDNPIDELIGATVIAGSTSLALGAFARWALKTGKNGKLSSFSQDNIMDDALKKNVRNAGYSLCSMSGTFAIQSIAPWIPSIPAQACLYAAGGTANLGTALYAMGSLLKDRCRGRRHRPVQYVELPPLPELERSRNSTIQDRNGPTE